MVIDVEDSEHRLEFAPIKPETVILPTVINLHFAFWTYYDDLHLFQTDRALAFARLAVPPFTQLGQQLARLRLVIYQQFDFTGIQPDSATGKAVVDFHFL